MDSQEGIAGKCISLLANYDYWSYEGFMLFLIFYNCALLLL